MEEKDLKRVFTFRKILVIGTFVIAGETIVGIIAFFIALAQAKGFSGLAGIWVGYLILNMLTAIFGLFAGINSSHHATWYAATLFIIKMLFVMFSLALMASPSNMSKFILVSMPSSYSFYQALDWLFNAVSPFTYIWIVFDFALIVGFVPILIWYRNKLKQSEIGVQQENE